jgi:hypothetical protein
MEMESIVGTVGGGATPAITLVTGVQIAGNGRAVALTTQLGAPRYVFYSGQNMTIGNPGLDAITAVTEQKIEELTATAFPQPGVLQYIALLEGGGRAAALCVFVPKDTTQPQVLARFDIGAAFSVQQYTMPVGLSIGAPNVKPYVSRGALRLVVVPDTFSSSAPPPSVDALFFPNAFDFTTVVHRPVKAHVSDENVTFPAVSALGGYVVALCKSRLLIFTDDGATLYDRQFVDPSSTDPSKGYSPDAPNADLAAPGSPLPGRYEGRRYGLSRLFFSSTGRLLLAVAADRNKVASPNDGRGDIGTLAGAIFEVYDIQNAIASSFAITPIQGTRTGVYAECTVDLPPATLDTIVVPSGYTTLGRGAPGTTVTVPSIGIPARGLGNLMNRPGTIQAAFTFLNANQQPTVVVYDLLSAQEIGRVKKSFLVDVMPRASAPADLVVFVPATGQHQIQRWNGAAYAPLAPSNDGTLESGTVELVASPPPFQAIYDASTADSSFDHLATVLVQHAGEAAIVGDRSATPFSTTLPTPQCPLSLESWAPTATGIQHRVHASPRPGTLIGAVPSPSTPSESILVIQRETACGTKTRVVTAEVASAGTGGTLALTPNGDLG